MERSAGESEAKSRTSSPERLRTRGAVSVEAVAQNQRVESVYPILHTLE